MITGRVTMVSTMTSQPRMPVTHVQPRPVRELPGRVLVDRARRDGPEAS